MLQKKIENIIFRIPIGLMSRLRCLVYKIIGMQMGVKNRFENGRIRCASQISIGNYNAFTSGYMLWPIDETSKKTKITIGNWNFFNRNLMLDACQHIEIGDNNLFGPDVYITDSNHIFGFGISPKAAPMLKGKVIIGNHCWIGAKVTILKDVVLGDYCVVAAGAVVTKSFLPGSIIGGVPAKVIKKYG